MSQRIPEIEERMGRNKHIIGVCTIVACFVATAISACSSGPQMYKPMKDSLHDVVMERGKIRCGYFIFPPYAMKDPNTHDLSGIFVDAIEEAAKNLGLKVAWTEEVGYGTMIEGIKANRYDLVPTGVWPNANRARYADFSIPLFYSGIGVYVRDDDHRFDTSVDGLNSKDITISAIDGTVQDLMARKDFPEAKVLSHPETSDASQILLDVTSKKADCTFIEPGLAGIFLKTHPGSIRNVRAANPIGVVGNAMMFRLGEPSFKSMLDTALSELINTGYIDKLIDKYQPGQGVYYRVAHPYEVTAAPPQQQK